MDTFQLIRIVAGRAAPRRRVPFSLPQAGLILVPTGDQSAGQSLHLTMKGGFWGLDVPEHLQVMAAVDILRKRSLCPHRYL